VDIFHSSLNFTSISKDTSLIQDLFEWVVNASFFVKSNWENAFSPPCI